MRRGQAIICRRLWHAACRTGTSFAAIVSGVAHRVTAKRPVRWRSAIVAGFCAAALFASHTAGAGDRVGIEFDGYRLGVFPYLSTLEIERIYGPVATQFSEELGRSVHLKTKPTFDEFAEELRKETYDIVLVHPFFYVFARDRHHYLPLARLEEPLTALVMVREDDSIATLADLRSKTIALPSALSAVSELIKVSLFESGLVPGVDVTFDHHRSKPSCLQAVAIGRASACAVPRFALSQIDPNNDLGLRTVFETDPVSGFVFAAHARVLESDRSDISRAILTWPSTAKGRRILAGGAWMRFVPARDEDFDNVRREVLKLQRFAQR